MALIFMINFQIWKMERTTKFLFCLCAANALSPQITSSIHLPCFQPVSTSLCTPSLLPPPRALGTAGPSPSLQAPCLLLSETQEHHPAVLLQCLHKSHWKAAAVGEGARTDCGSFGWMRMTWNRTLRIPNKPCLFDFHVGNIQPAFSILLEELSQTSQKRKRLIPGLPFGPIQQSDRLLVTGNHFHLTL